MRYFVIVVLMVLACTNLVSAKNTDSLNFKLSVPNLKQDQDPVLITQQKLIAEIQRLRETNKILEEKSANLEKVIGMYQSLTELKDQQIATLTTVTNKKDAIIANYEALVVTVTKQTDELKSQNQALINEVARLRKTKTRDKFIFTAIGFVGAQILNATTGK